MSWWPVSRARAARLAPWALGTAAAAYAVLQAHAYFMIGGPVAVSADEGSVAAFAMRLLEGHMLPYVDAVSQRGPLTYWLVAIAQGIGGSRSFLPLRLLAATLGVCTTVLVACVPLRLDRPLGGAVAGLTTAVCMTAGMGPHAGVGYNAELASLPFTLAGTWLVVRALTRLHFDDRVRTYAIAGALVGLGALSKQLAFIFAVPTLVVLGLGGDAVGASRRARMRAVAAFAAGIAAPAVCVILLYAITGHLGALYYWTVRYNASVYMAPITLALRAALMQELAVEHATLAWVGALLLAACLVAPWLRLRAARRRAPRAAGVWLIGLSGVCSLVAALAPARPWQNYFLYCVPWWSILLGLAVDEVARSWRLDWRARRMTEGAAAAFLSLITIVGVWCGIAFQNGPKGEHYWQRLHVQPICRYIANHSAPSDSIFVWGFRGDLYIACHRKPASRFVVTPPVAGWIPWFPSMSIAQENYYAVPGARQRLLSDLAHAKPAIIVDAPYASMAGRSMVRYRTLARFLSRHYCRGPHIGDVWLYHRRKAGQACPPRSRRTVKKGSAPLIRSVRHSLRE